MIFVFIGVFIYEVIFLFFYRKRRRVEGINRSMVTEYLSLKEFGVIGWFIWVLCRGRG